MNQYAMLQANTCTKCGAAIGKGEPVYAENFDAVQAGKGLCQECFDPPMTAPPEPVLEAKPEAVQTPIVEDAPAVEIHKKPAKRRK